MEAIKLTKVSKWVQAFIFISVFINSYIFFKYPFEGYFHYIIFITFIPIFMFKYGYPIYLIKLFSWFIGVGFIFIILGMYSAFGFIKVFGGMVMSLTFYHYALRYYKFNILQIFSVYLKWSYFVALIGIAQAISYNIGFKYGYDFGWLFNKWGVTEGGIVGIRINSVFSEPSGLAATLSPAVFVSIYNLIHKNNFVLNKRASIVTIITYVISSSSTAYIGLLIILIIISMGIRFKYLIIGTGIGVVTLLSLYNITEEFKSRVDSSIGLWVHQDYSIENTNTSSFVLYNSVHVAMESFKEYPLFGTGLGSYSVAYEKHSLTKNVEVIAYDFEFNNTDGNSLFVRMLVELGLVGIIIFFILMIRGFIYLRKEEIFWQHRMISQSIMILIFLNLMRQGNYFLNGFPFFILIYYYNWKDYKQTIKELDSK